MASRTDARKAPIAGAAALSVIEGVDEVYVVKGTTTLHVDLRKASPPRAELLSLLLGPTGNLRAPTVRKGRTLVVGFDAATYARVLR